MRRRPRQRCARKMAISAAAAAPVVPVDGPCSRALVPMPTALLPRTPPPTSGASSPQHLVSRPGSDAQPMAAAHHEFGGHAAPSAAGAAARGGTSSAALQNLPHALSGPTGGGSQAAATSQAPQTSRVHRCGKCGQSGHYRTTCTQPEPHAAVVPARADGVAPIDLGNLPQDEPGTWQTPPPAAHGEQPAAASVESTQRAIQVASSDAAGLKIKVEYIDEHNNAVVHINAVVNSSDVINLADSDSDEHPDESTPPEPEPEPAAAVPAAVPAKAKKRRLTDGEKRTGQRTHTKQQALSWGAEAKTKLHEIISGMSNPPQSISDWDDLANGFPKRTGAGLRLAWKRMQEAAGSDSDEEEEEDGGNATDETEGFEETGSSKTAGEDENAVGASGSVGTGVAIPSMSAIDEVVEARRKSYEVAQAAAVAAKAAAKAAEKAGADAARKALEEKTAFEEATKQQAEMRKKRAREHLDRELQKEQESSKAKRDARIRDATKKENDRAQRTIQAAEELAKENVAEETTKADEQYEQEEGERAAKRARMQ